MGLVRVFECTYLLADGIERDVVACAGVWFVEGVHEGWSEERGRRKEGELICASEKRLSRIDLGG